MSGPSGWNWHFEDADGRAVDPPQGFAGGPFPSQIDAETWVGESWRPLLEAGIEQVRLREGDREVYGPMSLRPGL